MKCGTCGGGIRGYRGTLHGRPIADWKHTDAPPGTTPHRPILGTPVDQATLDRIHRPRVEEAEKAPEAPPPRIVHSELAIDDQWDGSKSVAPMVALAGLEGWTVLPLVYRQRDDGVEYLVMRARRRDLGAIGMWRWIDDKAAWQFDDGWALTRAGVRRVQSTSLKEWLRTRDEECPDCGFSSVVHREECP